MGKLGQNEIFLKKYADFVCSKENLPYILSLEKDFYNKLSMLLDIDINCVLLRTCEKYGIKLSQEDANRLLYFFDSRKQAVDNTLKLVKKI